MKKSPLICFIIFLVLTLFFSLNFVSGFGYDSTTQENLGTFKQAECFELIQTCSNCTYNNISRVFYPNSSVALENAEMTKDDVYYNYSFCKTGVNGAYLVNGFGDSDGVKTIWNYNFEITPSGMKEFSILENSILIILLLLSSSFLFLGIYLKIPSLGFISSILILLAGIYTMIYGFSNVTNLYTRATAISILGLGFVIMFMSAYEWLAFGIEE